MRSRVVVTGLGVVSPIGIGVSDFWKAALSGHSGISAITSFDPFPMDGYRSKIAGQVRDFAVERFLDSAYGERVDRYAQFALVAVQEALADSGLRMAKENPHRIAVIVGAGMGGMVMGEPELYSRHHPEFGLRHYRDGLRSQGPQPNYLDCLLLQRPCARASPPLYP
jgi:3-oxoacyl-[acyl-carrier-protein] synthase II